MRQRFLGKEQREQKFGGSETEYSASMHRGIGGNGKWFVLTSKERLINEGKLGSPLFFCGLG